MFALVCLSGSGFTRDQAEVMELTKGLRKPVFKPAPTTVTPVKVGLYHGTPCISVENELNYRTLELGTNTFQIARGDGYGDLRCGVWLFSSKEELEAALATVEAYHRL